MSLSAPSPSPFAERVDRVLQSASFVVDAAGRELVLRYLSELKRWNAKLDLTAARGDDELVDLFVADAAQLAARLPRGATLIDVGVGAGAPGLVLALLRPELQITLVEPLAKRTSFMRSFWAQHAEARLPSLQIVRGRVEQVIAEGTRFEVAISRATFEPSEWLRCALELLREGGEASAWLLHAQHAAPEPPPPLRAEPTSAYVWPNTGRERLLTRFVRPAH